MAKYSSRLKGACHIHATGIKYYNELKKGFSCPGCRLVPYIEDMPLYLRAADVVICRSGAMTVAELARSGSAAILIPSPNVTANHQYKNAKSIVDRGGALMLCESELTAESLTDKISKSSAVLCVFSERAEN